MGFHEVQFSKDISFGSVGGPGFKTQVAVLDSGYEERVSRWNTPRRRFNVRWAVRGPADLKYLQEFFISRKGALNGFRYPFPLDFSSNPNADWQTGSPSNTDQTIGTGDGTKTQFQLVKVYSDGVGSLTQPITKPVNGTVSISFDDVDQPSGWTVNPTTGIVTFSVAPALDVVVKAGFEFDIPVRFSEEIDDFLDLTIKDLTDGGIDNIPLIEVLGTDEWGDDFYYGGGSSLVIGADYTLAVGDGKSINVTATTTGLAVKLFDPDGWPAGGDYFIVKNVGSNSFDIKDEDDVTLVTVAAGEVYILFIGKDTDGTTNIWDYF